MEAQIVKTIQDSACSISLTKNAKHEYQWEIKVYGNIDELENMRLAIEAQESILKQKYGVS